MPDVDLTTLSGPELRRLLDSTRARGQASLSYLILQEMAARREDRGRKRRYGVARRAAEPRTLTLETAEPREEELDIPSMPFWRPPPRQTQPTVKFEAEPPAEAAEPEHEAPAGEREATEFEGTPEPDLLSKLGPPPEAGPRRRSLALAAAAGFVAGAAMTAAIAVGIGWAPQPEPPAPIRTAALAAPVMVPPQTVAPPLVSSEPQIAPPPPDYPHEAVPPLPDAEDLADAEAGAAVVAPAAVVADPACATAPTPADRTICGDAELLDLQHELRRAYADALAAHQDRETLRIRQLAWRDLRNPVTDPAELAALYRERIGKLNAAAEAARRLRGAD